MQGIPRITMLSLELKESNDIPDFTLLQRYIESHYNENSSNYQDAFIELINLRKSCLNYSESLQSLSNMKRYFAQLQLIKARFPMAENQECSVTWKWEDCNAGTVSLSDIRFEEGYILFNIGCLHCNLGQKQSRIELDSAKIACTHFQCSAWAFQTVLEQYCPLGSDMDCDFLRLLNLLMLAQSHECLLEKSMVDQRRSGLVAKIAFQISDLYKQCQGLMKSENIGYSLNSVQYKNFKRICILKDSLYYSLSQYYMGLLMEESNKYGEIIAWLKLAKDKLDKCVKSSKEIKSKEIEETIRFVSDVLHAKLESCIKDNDFIYHEKVPEADMLTPIKGAIILKGLPLDVNDPDIVGTDIFKNLVPLETHVSASIYSEKKATVLREIQSEVDDKDKEIEQFIKKICWNNDTLSMSDGKISQQFYSCAAFVTANPEIITTIKSTMQDLSSISIEVEESLEQLSELIRSVDGSQNLNVLKSYQTEYSQLLKNFEEGKESNDQLREAFGQTFTDFQMFINKSIEQIIDEIPSLNKLIEPSAENDQLFDQCKRLLEKVTEMRLQRSELMDQLKNQMMSDEMTQQLLKAQNDEQQQQQIIEQGLLKHKPTMDYLQQNMSAQQNIMDAIVDHNAKIADLTSQIIQIKSERDSIINRVSKSFENHSSLLNKGIEGIEFYQKLGGKILKLQNQVLQLPQKTPITSQEVSGTANNLVIPPVTSISPHIGDSSVAATFNTNTKYNANSTASLSSENNISPNIPKLKDYKTDGKYKSDTKFHNTVPSTTCPTEHSSNIESFQNYTSQEQNINKNIQKQHNFQQQPISFQQQIPYQLQQQLISQQLPHHFPEQIPYHQSFQPIPQQFQHQIPFPQSHQQISVSHITNQNQTLNQQPTFQQSQPPIQQQQHPMQQPQHLMQQPQHPIQQQNLNYQPQNHFFQNQILPTPHVINSQQLPYQQYPQSIPLNTQSTQQSMLSQADNYQYIPQHISLNQQSFNQLPDQQINSTNKSSQSSSQLPYNNWIYYGSPGTAQTNYNPYYSLCKTRQPSDEYRTTQNFNFVVPCSEINQISNYSAYNNHPNNYSSLPRSSSSMTHTSSSVAAASKIDPYTLHYQQQLSSYYNTNTYSTAHSKLQQPNDNLNQTIPTSSSGKSNLSNSLSTYICQHVDISTVDPKKFTNTINNNSISKNTDLLSSSPLNNSSDAMSSRQSLDSIGTNHSKQSSVTTDTSVTILEPKKLTQEEIEDQKEEKRRQIYRKSSGESQASVLFNDNLLLNKFIGDSEKFLKRTNELIATEDSLNKFWNKLIEKDRNLPRKSTAIAKCCSRKNRSQDSVPYDENRVVIKEGKDDYINASYIVLQNDCLPKFITFQSPMPTTLVDFWTAVFEQACEILVQLAPLPDKNDFSKFGLVQYWPESKSSASMSISGKFDISVQSYKEKPGWNERILLIKHLRSNQSKSVWHFQVHNMTNKLPKQPEDFLSFSMELCNYYRQQRNLNRPIGICCFNGSSANGTLVLMISCLILMEINGVLPDPEPILLEMWSQRRHLLDDKHQLMTVYKLLCKACADLLSRRNIIIGPGSASNTVNPVTNTHTVITKKSLHTDNSNNTQQIPSNSTTSILDNIFSNQHLQINDLNSAISKWTVKSCSSEMDKESTIITTTSDSSSFNPLTASDSSSDLSNNSATVNKPVTKPHSGLQISGKLEYLQNPEAIDFTPIPPDQRRFTKREFQQKINNTTNNKTN